MMLNLFQTFMKNRHTTGAAIAYGVAYGVTQIGPIWFPHYAEQFTKTGDVIQKLAVVYGLVAAGDAAQSQKAVEDTKAQVKQAMESHDTSMLSKPPNPS